MTILFFIYDNFIFAGVGFIVGFIVSFLTFKFMSTLKKSAKIKKMEREVEKDGDAKYMR